METDKFKAKNWKKVPDKTFKKMAPQEKSRYMAVSRSWNVQNYVYI